MQTIAEFEAAAREKLDPVYYDFFAGAARDEITMRANEESFQRRWLLPRVLRGSDKRELGVTLFGRPVSMPILLSPTAFHRIAHPEGERATARAAALAGTIMIVSMAATTAVGDVVTAAREAVQGGDPTLWFQLYLQPDLAFSEAIVRRAEDAGVHALVVTVDSPVFGRRERDDRNNFHELPAGMFVENLRDDHAGTPRDIVMSAELSWQHIDWLRGLTSLPIVLKGVLHPEDARIAVSRGVDGLLVSNHGGRQLDTVPATIDALPELVEAVGGQLPLILDGGVRRGTDVVKALALGATAVGIGRPVMWGLAVAGQDGVSQVLELLREEFDHALALCGGSTPRDLTADLIRTY
jgi:4-hydroxymandelate oxidase